MKLKSIIILFALICGVTLQAQEHLAESKSLVGMWRLIGVAQDNLGNMIIQIKAENYKVINPDGTFYIFLAGSAENQNTQIGMYGTYAITSDSTFTEHIVKNSGLPQMNNSDSEVKYKFVPKTDNNVVYMMWKNALNGSWVPEMWERVILPKSREETQGV